MLKLTGEPYASKRADASYSNTAGTVCAVMTADCLPVLFAIVQEQGGRRRSCSLHETVRRRVGRDGLLFC
ncbi:laccase domain-containing protein [Shigella flexneri]